MRPDDIRAFFKRRPFQPFRMTLTDGRTYDIRHPEVAVVGRSTVTVGAPATDEPKHSDRVITISLLHIMQLETVNSVAGA